MTCQFTHDPALIARFPALRVQSLIATLPEGFAPPDPAPLEEEARARLVQAPEAEMAPIRAWRAAYAAMGHKPTQTRCAAEALLRRLRLEGALPRVSGLVDFGNAVSAAAAIPLAIFDLDRVSGDLTVTMARGDERFVTFGGAEERPDPGEVIFRDSSGAAHARRWAHRQGAAAATGPATRRALFVAEAMHDGAEADLTPMTARLTALLRQAGAEVQPGNRWPAQAG